MNLDIASKLSEKPAWWPLDDDRVVAWAGRTFDSLDQADLAVGEFRVNPEDPDHRVQARFGSSSSWTAWRSEGARVAASGDWFPDEGAARDAARRVRQRAATALLP